MIDNKTRKNILIIHSDQLRFDGITLNGAPEGLTPNIDSIASEGYNFTRHFASNPVCMPSRASLFTGLYPSGHGVWGNGIPLNRNIYNDSDTVTTNRHSPGFKACIEPRTIADVFKQAGYDTSSFGKLHFTPNLAHPDHGFEESYEVWKTGKLDNWNGPYYGFDHVEFAQGHGEQTITEGGHYSNWLKAEAPQLFDDVMNGKKKYQPFNKQDLYLSLIPSELHNSTWLAQRFSEHIQSLDETQPFFSFVGFPDPHHPFTPPFDAMEDVDNMALPKVSDPEGLTDSMPLQFKRGNGPGMEANLKVRDTVQRYTMAMIHLMDQAVGKIIDGLKQSGRWENTIVVFTSDHGDFLGDHGLCYKCLNACESLLHVPFLLRVPGENNSREMDCPMSNTDVLPTLISLAGVEAPEQLHGKDVFSAGQDHLVFAYAYHATDAEWHNFTVCDREIRLTYYPGKNYLEMFDRSIDPEELHNLADDSSYASRRKQLLEQLIDANIKHNAPIAGRVSCF